MQDEVKTNETCARVSPAPAVSGVVAPLAYVAAAALRERVATDAVAGVLAPLAYAEMYVHPEKIYT